MGRYPSPQKAEMLPGTLEMLILKSLERNVEPMHGYGIALYLRQISKAVLQVEGAHFIAPYNVGPLKAG